MTITAGTAQSPEAGSRTEAGTRHATAVRPVGKPGPRPRGRQLPGRPRLDALKQRLRRRWATLPARLRLARTGIVLLTAALGLLLLLAGLAVSDTWHTVAGRDAPRTTSAAGLGLALNDMDAQAANILLSSGDGGAGRMEVPYDKATGFYDSARRTVSRELRTLAVAAEGDAQSERTVEALTENFARYQELIGRALENDGRSGGKAAALDDYQSATRLLGSHIRPESQALIAANNEAYEAEYDAARSRLDAELIAAVVLGLLLLAALVVLQWYLAKQFHRILNPALLAGTLCAFLAFALGGQALAASSDHLRGARRDAFDSVVALSRARAIAYDGNADESRYLLFRQERTAYEQSFLDKSQQLYGIEGATLATYDTGVDETWAAYRTDHADLRFTGEFRRELDNITFPGERTAAERTVEAYAVYQRDDRTIRRLIAEGKEKEAIAFCISWDPGKSNAHFGAWMAALDQVTDINRTQFAASVREGRGAVSGLLPGAGGALVAAAALTVLGLRPRLAEFRA
ncbi:hypothetical protein [Streptomyces sp. NPDC019890]|uniref:hypothetical protein n=1 Tax=Streptomyces sp. NPDC019890 TaxID=3365064 RepID=UPI00384F5459